jgi:hypothetical protein
MSIICQNKLQCNINSDFSEIKKKKLNSKCIQNNKSQYGGKDTKTVSK